MVSAIPLLPFHPQYLPTNSSHRFSPAPTPPNIAIVIANWVVTCGNSGGVPVPGGADRQTLLDPTVLVLPTCANLLPTGKQGQCIKQKEHCETLLIGQFFPRPRKEGCAFLPLGSSGYYYPLVFGFWWIGERLLF